MRILLLIFECIFACFLDTCFNLIAQYVIICLYEFLPYTQILGLENTQISPDLFMSLGRERERERERGKLGGERESTGI